MKEDNKNSDQINESSASNSSPSFSNTVKNITGAIKNDNNGYRSNKSSSASTNKNDNNKEPINKNKTDPKSTPFNKALDIGSNYSNTLNNLRKVRNLKNGANDIINNIKSKKNQNTSLNNKSNTKKEQAHPKNQNTTTSEDEITEEENKSSNISLNPLSGLGFGKKKVKTENVVEGTLKTAVKSKIIILVIGIAAFLLVCLIPILLVGTLVGNFTSLFGINHLLGNDTGGINFVADNKNQERYFNDLKEVSEEYKGEKKEISAQSISAVFYVLQIYDPSFTYSDMSKSEMRKVADLMLDAIEQSDGSTTYKLNEATLKKNLAENYFPSKIPGKSTEVYQRMTDEVYEYIDNYNELINLGNTSIASPSSCDGISYWWPIGSIETTTEGGKLFATKDPEQTVITATFGGDDTVHNGNHGAIDIANYNGAGVTNIIAAKDGTVIYPTNDYQTSYGTGYLGCTDGGGFGNYVVIEHSDGTYTYYAHMAKNTITVRAGETVRQGQVIGKMGTSGSSTGVHLHFEMRVGADTHASRVDPLEYVKQDDPRPGCAEFSLVSTSLSKQEFISKMNAYCQASGNNNFCTDFASHAAEVYDVSLSSGVNPELVVVTAGTEMGWSKCAGLYNYWGIGISNGEGCSAGPYLTSLSQGIRKYAETLAAYQEGGSNASLITSRYNEREQAGCDKAGHGLPGTMAGMQSVYSWVGTYRYNPGSWGLGGCVYLNIIYGEGYCDRVPSGNNVPTTVCEQNDYTAYQLKGKIELRNAIFGL